MTRAGDFDPPNMWCCNGGPCMGPGRKGCVNPLVARGFGSRPDTSILCDRIDWLVGQLIGCYDAATLHAHGDGSIWIRSLAADLSDALREAQRLQDKLHTLDEQENPKLSGDSNPLASALRELDFYANRTSMSKYEKGPSLTQREARAIIDALGES